jgi:amidase
VDAASLAGGWALSPGEAEAYGEALRAAREAVRQVSRCDAGTSAWEAVRQVSQGATGTAGREAVRQVPRGDAGPAAPQSRSPADEAADAVPDRYNCFVSRCCVEPTGAGPLGGLDIGLKDNISLAGVPMSLGSAAMAEYVADADAAVVTMLRGAGARIVGKLRMDAFSFGSEGFGSGLDPHGRCDNPAAPGHLSGGSSSGAAVAAAAGLVDMAIGGDQGGSIRVPAAWCGVVGVKPTRGAVPDTGVVGLEPTIDAVGPIARSAAQAALVLGVLSGTDAPGQAPEPTSEPDCLAGLRIGLLTEGFGHPGGDPGVDAVVLEAVGRLTERGAAARWVSVPAHRECQPVGYLLQLLGAAILFGSRGYSTAGGCASPALIRALDRAVTERAASLPPRAKLALMLGDDLGSGALELYQHCTALARRLRGDVDQALDDVDILVLPTTPVLPPRYVPPASRLEALRRALLRPGLELVGVNTSPFNVTGHPAVGIPAGRSGGLPVGAMLVGRWSDDLRLLRIGTQLEVTA